MLSSLDILNIYKSVTKDSSSDNETRGKLYINNVHKRVIHSADWTFTDDEWYCATVDGDDSYQLPFNYGRLVNAYIYIGTTKYPLHEITDPDRWDKMTETPQESDSASDFMIFNDHIFVYPTPSTAGNYLYLKYKKTHKDFDFTEYTTGTASITVNTAAVTGGSTTWTVANAQGRWIKFTTDGYWYPIETRNGNTSLTLSRNFENTTVSGDTYRIAEIPLIPDGFQDMLWQWPAMIYFAGKGERDNAALMKGLYEDNLRTLKARFRNRTTNQVIKRGKGAVNANDFPEGLTEA